MNGEIMFIKNYGGADLVANIKDNKIVLTSSGDAITYVDENLITLTQLTNMFGTNVAQVTDTSITGALTSTYLRYFQTPIQLSTLYKVQLGRYSVADRLQSIFVNSGSVDIYCYNGATKPTALSQMVLTSSATHIAGEINFEIIPTYIAVKQNSGTSSEIVLSGIEIITSLGAIS